MRNNPSGNALRERGTDDEEEEVESDKKKMMKNFTKTNRIHHSLTRSSIKLLVALMMYNDKISLHETIIHHQKRI